jgi:uncharacterized protein (DUF4213/DUF364 family)
LEGLHQMALLADLIEILPAGDVKKVLIGLHWTAVVAEIDGIRRCGLASTLWNDHKHHQEPDIHDAGELETYPGLSLAAFAKSGNPSERSVGVAAINALLPPPAVPLSDLNAEAEIASQGTSKKVVLVGSFPFVPRLRTKVGELIVLEQHPNPGERSEIEAKDVIPSADIVAISGMALTNHTLENLLDLCSPQAMVILLGPSTPLSPVLFEYGVDILCGSLVTAIEPVMRAIGQGANFRQVHRAGVRLVSMTRSDLDS